MTKAKRDLWIDHVKVLACVLVVLGHFFQSMVKSAIIPDSELYQWFNQTIYFFHVPLFLICSGYLYQKYSKVGSFDSWKKNVLKKAVTLGIPYIAFSTVTWVLKTVFSSSVNDQIGSLFDTLVLSPASPYWYLYALFFVFAITPTFGGRSAAWIGMGVALVMKALSLAGVGSSIYAVSTVLANEIWFVIGMGLCAAGFPKADRSRQRMVTGVLLLTVFTALSVIVFRNGILFTGMSFGLGLIACAAVVGILAALPDRQYKALGFLARYTMPVFLMHTIFAAPTRTVLLKLGIENAALHVICGLAASFAGPILAAEIMKRIKWLEIFLYPGKYIKIDR